LKVPPVLFAFPLALATAGATPARPPPVLFSLPSVPRIRIEAARDRVLVMHDISLPRGEWQAGDVELYVAFGAPGAPRAIDARIYALDPDTDIAADSAFESIPVERAARRPESAYALLGSPLMAGAVLHISAATLRRALSLAGVARIQVRTLLDLPAEDARTGRELVVRLGVRGGAVLAMGRLEIASLEPAPWIVRAEAHLCGADADPYPLAIALLPPPMRQPSAQPRPTAPVLAVRHPSDDLCVRFWTS
jgi:hypothetical protein